jgi:hypothetical protein
MKCFISKTKFVCRITTENRQEAPKSDVLFVTEEECAVPSNTSYCHQMSLRFKR